MHFRYLNKYILPGDGKIERIKALSPGIALFNPEGLFFVPSELVEPPYSQNPVDGACF